MIFVLHLFLEWRPEKACQEKKNARILFDNVECEGVVWSDIGEREGSNCLRVRRDALEIDVSENRKAWQTH